MSWLVITRHFVSEHIECTLLYRPRVIIVHHFVQATKTQLQTEQLGNDLNMEHERKIHIGVSVLKGTIRRYSSRQSYMYLIMNATVNGEPWDGSVPRGSAMSICNVCRKWWRIHYASWIRVSITYVNAWHKSMSVCQSWMYVDTWRREFFVSLRSSTVYKWIKILFGKWYLKWQIWWERKFTRKRNISYTIGST